MYILCTKECKCDIADWDWEGYIGTTRVHSLAGTKMRDRQIWGVNTSAFVCLEGEACLTSYGLYIHWGVRSVGEARVKGIWNRVS